MIADYQTALIDADIVAFRVSAANTNDWGFGLSEDFDNAVETAINHIHYIQESVAAAEVLLCFTGKDNYRKKVLKTYKDNRKHLTKPPMLDRVKHELAKRFNSVRRRGVEADDLLGYYHTTLEDTILCSLDKDLLQIPGDNFNWRNDCISTVSVEDGLRLFYRQCLSGDSTDNYPGLFRIGTKKALKILADVDILDTDAVWSLLIKEYTERGYSIKYLLKMVRCAKILDKEHLTIKGDKTTVKLWSPPGRKCRELTYECEEKEKQIYSAG